MAKSQDQYNFQFLEAVTSRSSKRIAILGPIFFNIYINNILFALKGIDIFNFADGKTPYVCDSNLKSVLEPLEHNSEPAIAWFEMNYMKLNTDRYHDLITGKKNEEMWAELHRAIFWESKNVRLLGITLENNLKFV